MKALDNAHSGPPPARAWRGAGLVAAAWAAALLCPAAAVAHDANCTGATGKILPRQYIDACGAGDLAWHPDDNQISIVVNRAGEPATRICRWRSPEGLCYEITTTRPRNGAVVPLRTWPEFESFLRWARARDDVAWCLVPHPSADPADCVATADSCRECPPAPPSCDGEFAPGSSWQDVLNKPGCRQREKCGGGTKEICRECEGDFAPGSSWRQLPSRPHCDRRKLCGKGWRVECDDPPPKKEETPDVKADTSAPSVPKQPPFICEKVYTEQVCGLYHDYLCREPEPGPTGGEWWEVQLALGEKGECEGKTVIVCFVDGTVKSRVDNNVVCGLDNSEAKKGCPPDDHVPSDYWACEDKNKQWKHGDPSNA